MVFIVQVLVLRFARTSGYRYAHTIDTNGYLHMDIWLSMQHCREIATGSVENGWLRIRSI